MNERLHPSLPKERQTSESIRSIEAYIYTFLLKTQKSI